MIPPKASDLLYEFGPFILDTAQHMLRRNGVPVALTPKTFDLLCLFLQNSGRMLHKEELIRALWPNSIVEESNLTQQISTARKVLGEAAGEDRFIVTLPGRGYRFAAAVREVNGMTAPGVADVSPLTAPAAQPDAVIAPPANVAPPPNSAPPRHWPKVRAMAMAVALIVTLAAGYWTWRRLAAASGNARAPRSLAVLPFQNLKSDSASDFLSYSLADAVITKMAYVQSIAVRPSSAVAKYRSAVIDIPSVAAELHADALLTGNFIRDGDDLRITSQLVDGRTQDILWKGSFDVKYDRLLTLHDSVTQEIIRGLQLSLSPSEVEHLRPGRDVAPLAYEYYLRGVDLYSQNDFGVAANMLRRSAEIDPRYAPTWAHLGRCLTATASFELGGSVQYREAMSAYEKALALKPADIDAQIYMANLLTDTGNVERSVPLLRDALKTNPNHAEAHWELGYAYRFSGMLDASVAECERARGLDPGVKLHSSTLNGYLYRGEYQKFLDSLPKAADSAFIAFYRGFGHYHLGQRQEAARHFDRAFELRPTMLQARIGRALSDGIGGRTVAGLTALRAMHSELMERGVGDPEALYKVAQAYAVLGDRQSAVRVLVSSINNGFFPYPYFVADPLLASLRQEPEFARAMTVARERHERFRKQFF